MHGAPKDPKEAAQFGVKVVIIDVPRPLHGVFMADIGPAIRFRHCPRTNSKGTSRKSERYLRFVRFRPKSASPHLAD
jgi:hypothetical protein